jgi:ADP-heptose:LPS heptosyltransferase
MIDWNGKRVIISRTDSIGDVLLTLPMVAWLKESFPSITILFLGKGYTKSIVEAYALVDEFIDWNDYQGAIKKEQVASFSKLRADAIIHVFPQKEIATLAKKTKIKTRVGTSHRLFHLWTCTDRINFTRRKSKLHESQLNHALLKPFGLVDLPSLEKVKATTVNFHIPDIKLPKSFLLEEEYTIFHPKSQGSAKEWPIESYFEAALILANTGQKVVFTGTDSEGESFRNQLPKHENIIDSTGKLSLEQLMVLIQKARNLVACSTGPLHIAAYSGINTIGLYSPRVPIHPGRWSALGKEVNIIVNDINCPDCAAKKDCNCVSNISIAKVLEKLK